jgi:hypothetical protein
MERAGRRCRPRAPGCICLIAAEGLTAKRWTAPPIELPLSTARMMRSRRSMEIGAGMATTSAVST